MIVYIDGSGKDYRTERQVYVALCVPKEANRHLPGFLFDLKKKVYGVTETADVDPIRAMEIKAEKILNRSTFTRALEGNEEALKHVTLVERIFEELAGVKEFRDITIFAIIMPLLDSEPSYPEERLPDPLRFLLQRVNRLVEEEYPERTATIVLDQGNELLGDDRELLSRFFSHWYNRFDDFQRYISPTPFFVDSRLTPGIELADLIAGCLRLCWENNLVPEYLRPQWDQPEKRDLIGALQDPFLASLKRYLNAILSRVRNVRVSGEEYYGIYAPRPEKFELRQEVELEE